MSYNPLNRVAKKEFVNYNFARCTKNEVGDMPLSLKEYIGIAADTYVDYWTIEYEALDVTWPDGNPLILRFGTKLQDKNGNDLDETQKPTVNALAFAGLGITVFPDDPDYDADAVIGHVFKLEGRKFAPVTEKTKNTPIPVEHLGTDYIFDGTVRVLPSKGKGGGPNMPTPQVTASQATREITGDTTLEPELRRLLVGVENTKAAVRAALTSANFGAGLTLNGSGVTGLAISGKLGDAAIEAGIVDIDDNNTFE